MSCFQSLIKESLQGSTKRYEVLHLNHCSVNCNSLSIFKISRNIRVFFHSSPTHPISTDLTVAINTDTFPAKDSDADSDTAASSSSTLLATPLFLATVNGSLQRNQPLSRIQHIYSQLAALNLPPSIDTYNSLIHANLRAKNFYQALQLLHTMPVAPTQETFSILLRTLSRYQSMARFCYVLIQTAVNKYGLRIEDGELQFFLCINQIRTGRSDDALDTYRLLYARSVPTPQQLGLLLAVSSGNVKGIKVLREIWKDCSGTCSNGSGLRLPVKWIFYALANLTTNVPSESELVLMMLREIREEYEIDEGLLIGMMYVAKRGDNLELALEVMQRMQRLGIELDDCHVDFIEWLSGKKGREEE